MEAVIIALLCASLLSLLIRKMPSTMARPLIEMVSILNMVMRVVSMIFIILVFFTAYAYRHSSISL